MSSPYPRDDFDAVAPTLDGRRGAHRAAPRRAAGLLAPLVVAAVVAVAGGTAWVALSPSSGSTASAATTTGSGGDAVAGAAEGSAVDDASVAPAVAEGSDPSATPAQTPDRSVPVTVLNGTGTKGLAATTATTLEEGGWTVSSTGNATSAQRSAHQGTTVLYPSAELEVTASALATALGGSAALDDGSAASTLTVLLLP